MKAYLSGKLYVIYKRSSSKFKILPCVFSFWLLLSLYRGKLWLCCLCSFSCWGNNGKGPCKVWRCWLLREIIAWFSTGGSGRSPISLFPAVILLRMWRPSRFSGASKSTSQERLVTGLSLKGYLLLATSRSSFPGDSAFTEDASHRFFGVCGWLCSEDGKYLLIKAPKCISLVIFKFGISVSSRPSFAGTPAISIVVPSCVSSGLAILVTSKLRFWDPWKFNWQVL